MHVLDSLGLDASSLHLRLVAAGLLLWTGSGLAACGETTVPRKKAVPYVETWGERLPSTLAARADAPDPQDVFAETTQQQGRAARESLERDGPPYDAFVDRAYKEVDYELQFVDQEGLTERGESVWQKLESVHEHALNWSLFDLDRIQRLAHEVDHLETRRHAIVHAKANDREREAAVAHLTDQPVSAVELTEEGYGDLADALLKEPAGARLESRIRTLEDVRATKARKMAKLEHLMAVNAAIYARQMKHFRIKHTFLDPEAADYWALYNTDGRRPDRARGPFVADMVHRTARQVADDVQNPVAILHRRIKETLTDVLTSKQPGKVLADLAPSHPQYKRLKKAYDRYRSIVASGGWETVEPEAMGPGYIKPEVADLKRRLRAEGYYPDDVSIDETYGDALVDAVEAYQETHQMQVTGRPHRMFWESLNVPAKRRFRAIGLNMRRWRGANVRHETDDLYVLVNIPGAHAEVWHEQQLEMRFRVVVGNGKIIRSKEEELQKTTNETPTVSAYIDRVIYNPYWNLTDRIRRQEVLPKVRKSVVSTYESKLREMKAKVQRGGEKKTDSPANQTIDQLLVATGPHEGSSAAATGGSTEDGASPGESETASEPPSGTSSAATGGVGLSAAESGDDESTSSDDTTSDDTPDVSIDAYVTTTDDGAHVFDVPKIRRLLGKVASLDASSSSNGDASNESGSDEESPLESNFPYIDPTTGTVDVSSTDPDHVPAWYEENDYEVISPGDKWEYVRMKQGPSNALGQVKVIFPNPFNVYLHDTPKQDLFSRNIRAFSHGCMRMHKPFEFAEHLLHWDGQYDNYDVSRLLESKQVKVEKNGETKKKKKYTYEPIFLNEKVPVHVDYFTVRVDDQGRPHFFSDVYDYDSKALGNSEE